jgi:hypothetical protein
MGSAYRVEYPKSLCQPGNPSLHRIRSSLDSMLISSTFHIAFVHPVFTVAMYNPLMAKTKKIQAVGPTVQPETAKVFTGIKRRPITIQKPGTVNPTETLRRLRNQ